MSTRYDELMAQKELLSPPTEDLYKPLIQEMEHVRIREGLPKRRFSVLLGLHESHYSKITKTERMMSTESLLQFCRLFGYDISTLINSAYLRNADSVFLESAMWLSRLDNETLEDMIQLLQKSDEPEASKKLGTTLLEKLISYDHPMAFYLADTKVGAAQEFYEKKVLGDADNSQTRRKYIVASQAVKDAIQKEDISLDSDSPDSETPD